MKASHAVTIFVLGILASFFIGLLVGSNHCPHPVVDLPEEWQTLSNNANDPDLLVGHITGDTLYLRFDN
jgi:hypothetical protein